MRNHFQPKTSSSDMPMADKETPETNSFPLDGHPEADELALICKPNFIEPWRIFRIMSEFVDGFDLLRKYGLAATFFGSTRLKPDDALYQLAENLAARLAKSGFALITGGASGIMEAANKGAFEAGGKSVGINIRLPHEQHNNKYLTDHGEFHHFFVRKVMLSFASEVYIFFPGGFGTLDEFFEIVTLVQTKKIKSIPVILVGKEYWSPLLEYVEKMLYTRYHTISKEDLEIYHLVDTVDEAYELTIKLAKC